jgi:hypothetical protein
MNSSGRSGKVEEVEKWKKYYGVIRTTSCDSNSGK